MIKLAKFYFSGYFIASIVNKGMNMEVALKLNWPDHLHFFTHVIRTTDHHHHTEINYCRLCNQAAGQSGILTNRHFEHPKGCKCYWCVYCRCPQLLEREK